MTEQSKATITFCDTVIGVADKFINKVDTGKARSVETYSDLKLLKDLAKLLKNVIVITEN